ncbi:MAG: HPP family protein [Gammaproteobacteria bacterium]|nr:HPP family protein [Gammaproteobacteria bacterium]
MLRHHHANPARPPLEIVFRAWIGAVIGLGTVAWLSYVLLPGAGYFLVLGSFGATAVLLFGISASPFAQPRNLFVGHLLSGLIGVACFQLLDGQMLFAAPLAVATSVAAMQLTRSLHPPGGATALIAVLGPAEVHELGFGFLLPVLLGVGILFVAAVLSMNLFAKERRYPVV